MILYWIQTLAAGGVIILALWNVHLRAEGSQQTVVVIPAAFITGCIGLCNVWSGAPFQFLLGHAKGSVPVMWCLCVLIVYGWRLWDLRRGHR